MRYGVIVCFVAALVLGTQMAVADDSQKSAVDPSATTARKPHQAVERAVTFLVEDTVKWRQERGCATCHHGTMTIWALSEAKHQGHPVNAENLSETIAWTKNLFVPRINKPRDSRPGWSLVNTPAIYLGVMSQTLPILSRDEINQIASHLARHQEEDGAWLLPPPANGAPPIWESRETLAMWALLAWEPHIPFEANEAAKLAASREKAVAWLRDAKSSETNQATTLRLLLHVRTGQSEQVAAAVDLLLKRQNSDGGWSQTPERPSDAFATGQALYALSFAEVKAERLEIQRAISFLITTQRDDGSWPMTSRNHPGVETTRNPIRNPIPITYFGSAWATLGLVLFVPTAPDTPAKQQQAFDQIRSFHGKFDVDEKLPERPVVRVDLRYYEVSDEEVEKFANILTAFPRLESLEFKSSKITDAGLGHLKRLSQLRRLSLENAPVTDAGLAQLKELTYLEQLNVKGTKVTDAGVHEFQKILPKVTLER